jgi:hypothetical protein
VTNEQAALHCSEGLRGFGIAFVLALAIPACGGTLDAGWDELRGPLPVDDRNTIVLCNDGPSDNWQGEYAVLFANSGGPTLAGIIINDGWPWTNLDENITGWQQMVSAARDSGLDNIPDPMASHGPSLVQPSDENIDSTVPNRSEGASFIVDASVRWSQPFRPLVIVTGGRLTDVADAYLMDHTLPERVVVVSSLGAATENGAAMGVPNGWLDKWADIIVTRKFRYVQVSVLYDSASDVPSSLLSQLPTNPFGAWIASKQPNIENAYDQAGLQAVAMPLVVTAVARVVQSGVDAEGNLLLVNDPAGPNWLVTQIDSAQVTARFSEMLLNPNTYAQP